MKIMMVITGMQSGGAERVMATLCNELSQRHNVRLAVMKEAKSDYELSQNVEVASGNIQGKNLFKCVSFTSAQMKEYKPDIVLSFMTKSNIIAVLARLVSGIKAPVVIAERANPFYAQKIFKLMRKFLYPLANGFVFQTKQAQDYYKPILKNMSNIILKNPLNPDFKVEPYQGKRQKKIVTAGRLSVEKNQSLLIEAFSKIADKYPEYTVEIYGDGPLRGELESFIKDKKLENRVFLMGRRDNIQKYTASAEIFVLPSNSEGMPNALLEGMALGLACISTDCPIGGPAMVINSYENGILVPMNDADKMAQAIEYFVNNKEKAQSMGEKAKNVINEYDAKTVCRQWEEYLVSVAEEKR